MFTLGIDPGLSRCGYGMIEGTPGPARASALAGGPRDRRVCAAGVITTPVEAALPERLREMAFELRRLVADLAPDMVVVERVLFQTNARTAMSVGQASGIALLAAAEAGVPVAQYSANEVKQAVAGYGAATKAQVQRMVMALLHLEAEPQPPDVADALGLALCHLAGQGLRLAIEAATR